MLFCEVQPQLWLLCFLNKVIGVRIHTYMCVRVQKWSFPWGKYHRVHQLPTKGGAPSSQARDLGTMLGLRGKICESALVHMSVCLIAQRRSGGRLLVAF